MGGGIFSRIRLGRGWFSVRREDVKVLFVVCIIFPHWVSLSWPDLTSRVTGQALIWSNLTIYFANILRYWKEPYFKAINSKKAAAQKHVQVWRRRLNGNAKSSASGASRLTCQWFKNSRVSPYLPAYKQGEQTNYQIDVQLLSNIREDGESSESFSYQVEVKMNSISYEKEFKKRWVSVRTGLVRHNMAWLWPKSPLLNLPPQLDELRVVRGCDLNL